MKTTIRNTPDETIIRLAPRVVSCGNDCPFFHFDGYSWCWLDPDIPCDEMGKAEFPHDCRLQPGVALTETETG